MNEPLSIFYGGSFFPPHRAHDEILCHLLQHPDVCRVILVPTNQNPLKEILKDSSLKDQELKRRVLEAWLNSLKNRFVDGFDKLIVDWREFNSRSPSYTVETVKALQLENTSWKWGMCVGSDCLPQLEKWKDIQQLLIKLNELWVFQRLGDSEGNFINSIPAALREKCVWRLMTPIICEVSSTQLRELLQHGDAKREELNSLLLPEVAELLVDRSNTP